MAEITRINSGVHACGTRVRPRYLNRHTECSGQLSHTCCMILMCLLSLQGLMRVSYVLVKALFVVPADAVTQTYPLDRVVGRRAATDADVCGVSTRVKEEERGGEERSG